MKQLLIIVSIFLSFAVFAQEDEIDSVQLQQLSDAVKRIEKFEFKTGKVSLANGIELNLPQDYKFLDKKDAEYVVVDFWGNPPQDVMGLLAKKDWDAFKDEDWAFIITYDDDGYIKDEDAQKIDYDEMLSEMQKGEDENNKERNKQGYESIHLLGWATKPFYDEKNNILHWARSLKFGNISDTTLNYDVRILGRKGVLSLNAVAAYAQLEDVRKHIPDIIHIATFTEGNRYSDFNPSVDKVAAYTIGGLVAGKVLAKVGIFALLLKNIKLILLGVVAFIGGFRKKIANLFRRKKEDEVELVQQDLISNRE